MKSKINELRQIVTQFGGFKCPTPFGHMKRKCD